MIHRPARARWVFVAMVAALVVVGVPWALDRVTAEAESPYVPAVVDAPPPPPLKVSIIGDSFSVGVGAEPLLAGYAHVLAARGCWLYNLVAHSGTGYAASPDPFTNPVRVANAAATVPDLILVQGSGNDRGDPVLFGAAVGLYAALRVVAPQARIVVVGPTGAPLAKHDNIDEIRRILRDATAAAGVTFVDPLAEGWLSAPDFTPDGIHPNTRGHARMADRLLGDLTALGIPRVDGCR